MLAKTTRNATIGFVVLGYAIYWAELTVTIVTLLLVIGAAALFNL